MTVKKKEFESELIVTNILTKDDRVTLDLRFAETRFEETKEKRLVKAIEPLPKSPAEKVGRDYMKGVMEVAQRQMQQQMQPLTHLFPSPPPPDTVRITLSKQEYVEIGKPAVFDKLVLRLRMKTAS